VLTTIVVIVSLKGEVIVQLPFDVLREGSGQVLQAICKQSDADLSDRNDSRLCFVKLTLEILRYMTP
jgi:hypothetical protein